MCGINHHGFAQGDKFCPAGFIGRPKFVGGKQVAHADKRQFAVDAFVDKLLTGLGGIAAATDFFIKFPQGNDADIAAVLYQCAQSAPVSVMVKPSSPGSSGGEAVADNEIVALVFFSDGNHGIDNGQREAHSVFQAAAPLVVAAVAWAE